jgi:hypothetical protein
MQLHALVRKLENIGYCRDVVQTAFLVFLSQRACKPADVLDNEENVNALLDIIYNESGGNHQHSKDTDAEQDVEEESSDGNEDDYENASDSNGDGHTETEGSQTGSEAVDADWDVQANENSDVGCASHRGAGLVPLLTPPRWTYRRTS